MTPVPQSQHLISFDASSSFYKFHQFKPVKERSQVDTGGCVVHLAGKSINHYFNKGIVSRAGRVRYLPIIPRTDHLSPVLLTLTQPGRE